MIVLSPVTPPAHYSWHHLSNASRRSDGPPRTAIGRTPATGDVSWQPQLAPPQRFKHSMERYYSERSATYDHEGEFHPKMADLIVDLAKLRPGHRVLDMCTGTGQVAIRAARRVGTAGRVLGIDFSLPMLEIASRKLPSLPHANFDLLRADVEKLPPTLGRFDRITCASALVLLRDIPQTLRDWREHLAADGQMVFDGPSSTAFMSGNLLAEAAAQLNLTWPVDHVLGSRERAHQLLNDVDLELVSFTEQPHGGYLTIASLEKGWEGSLPFLCPATPPDLREPLRQCYMQKVALFMKGRDQVWNDGTMNIVVARKRQPTS